MTRRHNQGSNHVGAARSHNRAPLPWTPAQLFAAGAEGAFYEPEDTATLFADSAGTTLAEAGGPVGKVVDKSGNGHHLTQATAGARPLLQAAGRVRYLAFDGADDTLAGTLPVAQLGGNLSKTVVIGARYPAASDLFDMALLGYGETGTNGKLFGVRKSGATNQRQVNQWGAGADVADGNVTLDADFVLTVIKNGDAITIRVDGAVETGPTAAASANVTSDAFTLGSWFGTGQFMLGRIHSFILVEGVIDPALAEQWTAARQGRVL